MFTGAGGGPGGGFAKDAPKLAGGIYILTDSMESSLKPWRLPAERRSGTPRRSRRQARPMPDRPTLRPASPLDVLDRVGSRVGNRGRVSACALHRRWAVDGDHLRLSGGLVVVGLVRASPPSGLSDPWAAESSALYRASTARDDDTRDKTPSWPRVRQGPRAGDQIVMIAISSAAQPSRNARPPNGARAAQRRLPVNASA